MWDFTKDVGEIDRVIAFQNGDLTFLAGIVSAQLQGNCLGRKLLLFEMHSENLSGIIAGAWILWSDILQEGKEGGSGESQNEEVKVNRMASSGLDQEESTELKVTQSTTMSAPSTISTSNGSNTEENADSKSETSQSEAKAEEEE